MNKLNHLAIIVDGNGRWAKSIGKIRSYGHLKGYENLKKIINYVNDNLDIKYISLLLVYLFFQQKILKEVKMK